LRNLSSFFFLTKKKKKFRDKAVNLNDMKKMLATLPQFQNMKEKFSVHLSIAQECMSLFERERLAETATIEQVWKMINIIYLIKLLLFILINLWGNRIVLQDLLRMVLIQRL
jgi:hypothetical protein